MVSLLEPERRDKVLRVSDVSDVWGIGRRMTEHLKTLVIRSAWDLSQADAWPAQAIFGGGGENGTRAKRDSMSGS